MTEPQTRRDPGDVRHPGPAKNHWLEVRPPAYSLTACAIDADGVRECAEVTELSAQARRASLSRQPAAAAALARAARAAMTAHVIAEATSRRPGPVARSRTHPDKEDR